MLRTWILLVCFIAGQLMVFAHQHPDTAGSARIYDTSKATSHQVVKEKCYMCDVMHHNAMDITSQVYLNPVTVAGHVFKSVEYSFKSIRLIHSCGRAPPLSNFLA